MTGDTARLAAAIADRYLIERELGAGGMATVYLAEDVKHHRRVAIKVLRSDLAQALGTLRFQREVELAARLAHPHILALFDSGVADDTLYYVMPFVDGESLRAKLAREGALPIAETCRILRDVADALAYAHRHGVVHRDIKPENILLSEGHALVADFGVAKAVHDAAGVVDGFAHTTLTTAGMTLGTPTYMSPEQASADKQIDSRADLYALGVVAYEMLTGRPPFVGATMQQVLAAQVSEAPDPVTKRRSSIPAPVAAIVMQCLAKNPADRPRNAESLLAVLEGATTSGVASTSGPAADSSAPREKATTGRRRAPLAVTTAAILALIAAGGGYAYSRQRIPGGGPERVAVDPLVMAAAPAKSIAVLPFDNLSADTSNAYFAVGTQDEILTRLGGIHDLKVIARTSAAQYASHPQDVARVAQQLGVATLLEGSVQRAGDQVRVSVQLVDSRSGAQLWANSYDRNVRSIFAVESEIAQHVADALKAQLLPAEAARVTSVPTQNAAAYDLFLEAEYAADQTMGTGLGEPSALAARAAALYRQAIALDSTFALADAQLSYLDSYSYWIGFDHSQARLDSATREAQRAVALQPNLPESHLAMGYLHYWGHRDYPAALREFETARQNLPNDARVISAIGYVSRRGGDTQSAIADLRRAELLDPRDPTLPMQLGNTLALSRQYDDAIAAFDRAVAVHPGDYQSLAQKAWVLALAGRPTLAHAVWATIPASTNPKGETSIVGFEIAWLMRQPDSALAIISRAPDVVWEPQSPGPIPAAVFAGQALAAKGESTRSHKAYDDARQTLEAKVRTDPSDADAWSWLGMSYAGLGREADAIHAGRRASELLPISRDAVEGSGVLMRLAEIYAHADSLSQAVPLLRQLLAIPSGGFVVSAQLLRIDPTWDRLRADPTFTALLTPEGNEMSDVNRRITR